MIDISSKNIFFFNDKLKEMKPMGIHNESYAEDAAENFVFQVGVN